VLSTRLKPADNKRAMDIHVDEIQHLRGSVLSCMGYRQPVLLARDTRLTNGVRQHIRINPEVKNAVILCHPLDIVHIDMA
jgi:hypothetical protein